MTKNLSIFYLPSILILLLLGTIYLISDKSSNFAESIEELISNGEVNRALDELELRNNDYENLNFSQKKQYLDFIFNKSPCIFFDCTEEQYARELDLGLLNISNFIAIADQLKNLDNLLESADYYMFIAQLVSYEIGGGINYEAAYFTNQGMQAVEQLKLSNDDPIYLNFKMSYLIYGNCSYYFYDIDSRCDELKEITDEDKINFINETYKYFTDFDYYQASSYLRIISESLIYLYSNEMYETIDIWRENLRPTLAKLDQGEQVIEIFKCYNIECFKDLSEKFVEDELIDLDPNEIFNNDDLQNAIHFSIMLADKAGEKGELEKQLNHYTNFIHFSTELYNNLDFESKNNFMIKHSYSFFEIIVNAMKLSYEIVGFNDLIDFDISLDDIKKEIFIDFKIDSNGPARDCFRDSYLLENCPYTHVTMPRMQIKNLAPNSILRNYGIEDEDYLIAVNDWLVESTLNFNLFSQDNPDLFIKDLIDQPGEDTSFIFLKKPLYEAYKKLKNNKEFAPPLPLKRITIAKPKSDKFQNTTDKLTFDFNNLAFQAAQFLMQSKASDSYEKMIIRKSQNDKFFASSLKSYQDHKSELHFLEKEYLFENTTNSDVDHVYYNNKINSKKNEIKSILAQFPEIESKSQVNVSFYELKDIIPHINENEILVIYLEDKYFSFVMKIGIDENYGPYTSIHPVSRVWDPLNYMDYSGNVFRYIYMKDNSELRKTIIDDIKLRLKFKEYDSDFSSMDHPIRYLAGNMLGDVLWDVRPRDKLFFLTNVKNRHLPISIFSSLNFTKKDNFSTSIEDYIKYDFLNEYVSISNLINLKSLIESDKGSFKYENLSFLGIGDPILNTNKIKSLEFAQVDEIIGLFRNSNIADKQMLSKLTELPETSEELINISQNFKNNNRKLLLRDDATETNIKTMDLRNYDIISFATHGIPANNHNLFDEPGLVLTLPQNPNVLDDGYLTPTEISKLDLNAEIVILSACNTSSGSRNDNQILSGLAQAFLYAGAKSIVVSNWPVESRSTVIFMNNFMDNLLKNEGEPAEAFRNAQLYLRENFPEYDHPAYWGAFSYYGP